MALDTQNYQKQARKVESDFPNSKQLPSNQFVVSMKQEDHPTLITVDDHRKLVKNVNIYVPNQPFRPIHLAVHRRQIERKSKALSAVAGFHGSNHRDEVSWPERDGIVT